MAVNLNMNDLLKAKKVIVIIAHPDDEPGGTVAKLTKNSEVQFICVTDGDSPGTKIKNLKNIRNEELKASCKILGVNKIHFLGYKDGSLSNDIYHEIAAKIEKILRKEKPDTLITFEPRGFSGHLDHIAVSMITTFVFEKLRFIKNLYYFCMSERNRRLIPKYFVYMPPGYKKGNIDVTVNISDVWKTKVLAMKCHKSQMHDIRRILLLYLLLPKEEYFLKYKK